MYVCMYVCISSMITRTLSEFETEIYQNFPGIVISGKIVGIRWVCIHTKYSQIQIQNGKIIATYE